MMLGTIVTIVVVVLASCGLLASIYIDEQMKRIWAEENDNENEQSNQI